MGVDDFMDKEAGMVAAATAAAVSPRARELFRRGAVYGLAGVLRAGDVAVSATRGAVRGAKDGASEASPQSRAGTSSAHRAPARQRSGSRQRSASSRRKS